MATQLFKLNQTDTTKYKVSFENLPNNVIRYIATGEVEFDSNIFDESTSNKNPIVQNVKIYRNIWEIKATKDITVINSGTTNKSFRSDYIKGILHFPSTIKTINTNLSNTDGYEIVDLSNLTSLESITYRNFLDKYQGYSLDLSALTKLTSVTSTDFLSNCKNITELNLTPIEKAIKGQNFKGGFNGCTNLKRIIGDFAPTEITGSTFRNCSSLEELNINSTINRLTAQFCYGCTSLSKLEIKEIAETNLPAYFCANCKSLKNITLNCTNLQTIGHNVFYGASQLQMIIGTSFNNLTRIGDNFCADCSKLLTVGNGVITSMPNIEYIGANFLKNTRAVSTPMTMPKLLVISDSFLAGHNRAANVTTMNFTLTKCIIVGHNFLAGSGVTNLGLKFNKNFQPTAADLLFLQENYDPDTQPEYCYYDSNIGKRILSNFCANCANLSTLSIDGFGDGFIEDMDTFLYNCPNIQSITITDSPGIREQLLDSKFKAFVK